MEVNIYIGFRIVKMKCTQYGICGYVTVWKHPVEVCFLCVTYYVLVLFVSGGWYSSCSDT